MLDAFALARYRAPYADGYLSFRSSANNPARPADADRFVGIEGAPSKPSLPRIYPVQCFTSSTAIMRTRPFGIPPSRTL